MIRSLNINDPNKTPVKWWSEVDALKGIKQLDFNPTGLTILFGPNGSGKSTILKALAKLTHCDQGGIPKVTQESQREFYDFEKDSTDFMSIVTDGQPVHLADPRSDPGLIGGSFDYDFLDAGLDFTMYANKMSSGQRLNMVLNRIMKSSQELTEVEISDRSKEKLATAGLKCSEGVEKGARTVLLDEPSTSLDIPSEASLWDLFQRASSKFQFIIATHSYLALDIKGATYIDLVPNYREKCKEALRDIQESYNSFDFLKLPPTD